ncbi:transcriptional regulator [Escherichia coli]|nr:transcriptional regulator [Escherichia coli]
MSVIAGKPTLAASFSFSDMTLLAGDGVQIRSGNIIPRMVSKLTLSLRPGRHQKIAHTLIGKQHL